MLNDKKNFLSFRISWPLIIVIISILMSVAYTTVNDVSLSIDGDVVAMQYKGVFIYDIQYKNSSNSNYSNDLIKVVSNTLVNSYVELSSSNSSSSVTYTITVLNNDDYAYEFSKAVFDEEFYNNENIIFDLNNTILPGDLIDSGGSLSFDITFKYKDGVTPNALINKLEAYVNFEFVPIAMLKATNSSDTSAFRSSTYKSKIRTITLQNEINVPDNAIESWDIGVSQTGNVMSYVVPNATDSSYYDLYIQSDTSKMYGNADMSFWFSDLNNLNAINGLELLDVSTTTKMNSMFKNAGLNSTSFVFDLSNFDTSNVTNMGAMFEGFGLKHTSFVLDLSTFDTSNVTNMSYMFFKAGNSATEVSLDISNFETSNVTTMSNMFRQFGSSATVLNLDLSNFDTSNVTTMSSMFYQTGNKSSEFSLNISSFDTGNVKTMASMFYQTGRISSNLILDVSNFDTSKVTDMSKMFYDTGYSSKTFNIDVSGFDTSNVTDMNFMFYGIGYNSTLLTLDVSEWNVDKVTNMSSMFRLAGRNNNSAVSLDLSNWNTSKVTDMNNMFSGFCYACSALELNLSGLETNNVTSMASMFYATAYSSSSFTLNVSSFDTSKVTNMASMFYQTGYKSTDFILDVSSFDTSNVTNMESMFNGSKVKTIYVSDKWNTSNVTSSGSMFSNCDNLVGGLGTTYTSSFTDKTYARIDGGVSQPGYLTLVPVGYTMLNYIESTGTQYIDTGYSSDEGFKWDMLFEYTDEIISRYIIGSHGDVEPYGRNGFRYETNGNYWQLGLGDGHPTYAMSISLNAKYRINGSTIKGNNYVNLNGNRIITSANAEERSANSVMLLNNQYGLKYYDTSVKGKIYFVKIYDGFDNLVRNLSPCINSSGEVGLYDFVNNQFYGNSGTGTFKTV